MNRLNQYRHFVLYLVLLLALLIFALDRSAAYLHRPDPESSAVVIYTTTWCAYCKRLRVYLDRHGISYTDYDVEKSFYGSMGFWALRGHGVPVSIIGPDIIHGFDMDRIQASLAKLGYRLDAMRNNGMHEQGSAEDTGVSRL